jgi:large subunit ribosomal protein L2
MAIRKFKPTSPSRRFYEAPDFDMITHGKPEKKLLEAQKQTAGRKAATSSATARSTSSGTRSAFRRP